MRDTDLCTFQHRNPIYNILLIVIQSKGLKVTIVNLTCHPVKEGSLEITSTAPFKSD